MNPYRDAWGFIRRAGARDREAALVAAAKSAVAAVHPRRVVPEVIEWALEGGAERLRRKKAARKPFQRIKPVEDAEPTERPMGEILVDEARDALAKLKPADVNKVLEWAVDVGIGRWR